MFFYYILTWILLLYIYLYHDAKVWLMVSMYIMCSKYASYGATVEKKFLLEVDVYISRNLYAY